jgi:hypothetical protein
MFQSIAGRFTSLKSQAVQMINPIHAGGQSDPHSFITNGYSDREMIAQADEEFAIQQMSIRQTLVNAAPLPISMRRWVPVLSDVSALEKSISNPDRFVEDLRQELLGQLQCGVAERTRVKDDEGTKPGASGSSKASSMMRLFTERVSLPS